MLVFFTEEQLRENLCQDIMYFYYHLNKEDRNTSINLFLMDVIILNSSTQKGKRNESSLNSTHCTTKPTTPKILIRIVFEYSLQAGKNYN